MTTITVPVQYTNSQSETPVAVVSFKDFTVTDCAEPTSRVLDGSDDHGYDYEWAEPGYVTIEGEKREAACMYLFTAEELEEIEDPENYPWDEKHVGRILLKD